MCFIIIIVDTTFTETMSHIGGLTKTDETSGYPILYSKEVFSLGE